jgi:hypothetical protein
VKASVYAIGVMGLAACGDQCEQLCQTTAARVANCRTDGLSWADLGARGRADLVNGCRTDWDRASAVLSANDLREALEVCNESGRELRRLSCEEIDALYVPLD